MPLAIGRDVGCSAQVTFVIRENIWRPGPCLFWCDISAQGQQLWRFRRAVLPSSSRSDCLTINMNEISNTIEKLKSLEVSNPLKPSGHHMYRTAATICTAQWSLYVPHSGRYMYHQFNIQQFYVMPTQCICVFCVDLRTNSHYFPIQHELTGFYNRDGVCLLRGTDWVFM
jgi:hypothetical protein